MEKMQFNNVLKGWISEAKALKRTIVLPEAEYSERIRNAGRYVADQQIAKVIFLVTDDKLKPYENEYLQLVNITNHEILPILASALFVKRQHKGVTLDDAMQLLKSPIYFATMMVELGLADGMVAGAETSTGEVLRPALQLIKAKPNEGVVSAVMLMIKGNQKYALADPALNVAPTAEQLATIAMQTASSAIELLGVTPHVALLSYSTKGSADGESVSVVRSATEILLNSKPHFDFDGEMQLDSAICGTVRTLKAPTSSLKSDANVLIFPNIDAGNIGYKIMQRFGGFDAVGPIIQGLNHPVNDVSRGANEKEIVAIIAVTAVQSK